jgi:3-dehydroquinate synthase class II
MTTPRFAFALIAGLTLAAAAPAETVRGVVSRVDLDKNELQLEGRGRGLRGVVLTFALSDKTAVMFGDQAGVLSDLETGRRVRIEYQTTDAGNVAQVVHVLNGRRPAAAAIPDVPPVPAVPTDADALTGVLRRVGYSDREVVLVGPGANGAATETTVAVPENARIVKDGKDATLDDLKEGDDAAIEADKKDGRLSALSIQVGPGVAPAPENRRAKVIPRIRKALQMVDQLLKGMEDRNSAP